MSKNKEKQGSRNDQRSDAKNPNNPARKIAADNRSNQLNPNNKAYRGSRSGKPGLSRR